MTHVGDEPSPKPKFIARQDSRIAPARCTPALRQRRYTADVFRRRRAPSMEDTDLTLTNCARRSFRHRASPRQPCDKWHASIAKRSPLSSPAVNQYRGSRGYLSNASPRRTCRKTWITRTPSSRLYVTKRSHVQSETIALLD